MIVIVISAIATFISLIGVVFAMYADSRKKNKETVQGLVDNAKMQTEISRDIRDNTQAMTRMNETIKGILDRLERQDGEMRIFRDWSIKTDAELKRIDNRAQQAFNRHDDRKKEYEEAMKEIMRLREQVTPIIVSSS